MRVFSVFFLSKFSKYLGLKVSTILLSHHQPTQTQDFFLCVLQRELYRHGFSFVRDLTRILVKSNFKLSLTQYWILDIFVWYSHLSNDQKLQENFCQWGNRVLGIWIRNCTCAALCLHLCHTVCLAACGYINHSPPKKRVYFCIFVCRVLTIRKVWNYVTTKVGITLTNSVVISLYLVSPHRTDGR